MHLEYQFDCFNDDSDQFQIVGETEDNTQVPDTVCLGGFKPQVPEAILKIGVEKAFITNKILEEDREFTIDLDGNKKIKDKSIGSNPEPEISEIEIPKKKIIKQKKAKNIEPSEFKLFNLNKNLKNLRSHYNKNCFFLSKKDIGMNIKGNKINKNRKRKRI